MDLPEKNDINENENIGEMNKVEKRSEKELNKDNNKKEFYCPHCQSKYLIEQNPIFCMRCGYRFPRDENGKIIIDDNGFAIQPFNPTAAQIAGTQIIPGLNQTTVPQPQYTSMIYNPQQPINQGYPPQINQSFIPMQPRKRKTYSIGGGFAGSLVATITMIIASIILLLFTYSLETTWLTLIVSTTEIFFFIIPVLWIKRYYPKGTSLQFRLKELGFDLKKYNKKEMGREIILGTFLGLAGQILVFGLQYVAYYIVLYFYKIDAFKVLSGAQYSQFQLGIPQSGLEVFIFVIMIIFFVGPTEELMFRGFVQKSFESRLRKSSATLLTAVYFALFHIILYITKPPVFMFLIIPYLGVSILLGLIRNWRNDLFAAITAHIVYDVIQTIILFMIFL